MACSALCALTQPAAPPPTRTGDTVSAGCANYNGRLAVRATAAAGDTAVAEVARLVEEAQARSAPVQRLADAVAGRFAVGVMALAAGTFAFWAGAGPRLFPQASALRCAVL